MDVRPQPVEQSWSHLDLPYDGVTTSAEQAPHPLSVVAVVDHELAGAGLAEQALAALRLPHRHHLIWCEVILPGEPCPQVFSPRRIRVLSAPLAQPLVPAAPVGLSVSTVPVADTRTAFPASATPIGVIGIGLIDATYPAGHFYSLARLHGMGLGLDSPCHADVLLELANA